jgi:hypothetical protein
MIQDQRSEEHTKVSELAMAVMDLLNQNWKLKLAEVMAMSRATGGLHRGWS